MTDRPLLIARLVGKRLLAAASQSYQLDFQMEDGSDFVYLPGQFISIVFPGTYPDGHVRSGESRDEAKAYSLASAPRGSHLQLAFNRTGPFSDKLCNLAIEDVIRFHGPYGAFVRREPHTPSLFIGADAGIIPIRSIFRNGVPAHSTLIQIAATREDLLYRDEFANASSLRYLPMVAPELSAVEERMRKLLLSHPEIQAAYLCGLNDVIAPLRALLKTLGWDRKQIIFERFD